MKHHCTCRYSGKCEACNLPRRTPRSENEPSRQNRIKRRFPEVFFGLLPVVFPYIKALGVRNFLLFCSIEQREVLHEEGTIY